MGGGVEAGEGSVESRRMWWWGSPGAERGGAEGRDGWRQGRGVSPRSGDDAGVGWGWRGATGALGRLFEFQLPPHYINTHWCHTLVTHVFTHTQRH